MNPPPKKKLRGGALGSTLVDQIHRLRSGQLPTESDSESKPSSGMPQSAGEAEPMLDLDIQDSSD